MTVPASARWWIATLAIVGVLLAISALALDRPNVVWVDATPCCPNCRTEVAPYGERCPHCAALFDWVIAADDAAPISRHSLSEEEFAYLGQMRERLGREAAAAQVAKRLTLSPEAAARWLSAAAPGRCGLCGGTGEDLASSTPETPVVCEICFGAGASIACGGDRRMRLGDGAAARGLEHYLRDAHALMQAHIPAEQRRAALRRLTQAFLLDHSGSVEAARLPDWRVATERGGRGQGWEAVPAAADTARRRVDDVLDALEEAADGS